MMLTSDTEAHDGAADKDEHCRIPSFFEAVDTFMGNLSLLLSADDRADTSGNADHDGILRKLFMTLDLYQEQPHLLDPHLERIVQPVVEKLRNVMRTAALANGGQQTVKQQPSVDQLFQFLYYICKVRGYKTAIRFFTHEAADLEPTFHYLLAQDRVGCTAWEARYVLLLWLSLLSRIPFDLKRIDSDTGKLSLVSHIIQVAKSYLSATGEERDGAAVLLSRLLTRKDTINHQLPEFLEWSIGCMKDRDDIFTITGVLSALCGIYQMGEREMLLPTLDMAYQCLQVSETRSALIANNALVRKQIIKLTTRLGLCHLKPTVAKWRYQRGNRSLLVNLDGSKPSEVNVNSQQVDDDEENVVPEAIEDVIDKLLGGLRDKDTITRWSAAKGIGRITNRLPKEFAQDVISCLIDLFENDTFSDSDGKLDLSAVSDSAWHGACLGLAEVARRGLLLPNHLDDVMPWIARAVKFDQKRGAHSIGAHVRDAACYVCWSFARAYAQDILKPHAMTLASSLIVVSVFDREVNVRRAASAAFQENVGRMGIFPHGIEILTAADYFSVGNRTNAYLEISPQIARFTEYRHHIIDHLVSVSSCHWDKTIRQLAASTLGKLTPLDLKYIVEKGLPYLIDRAKSTGLAASHGSLLCIAEIIVAWFNFEEAPIKLAIAAKEDEDIKRIAYIPLEISVTALQTFGSELTRHGATHLIACLSRAQWPINRACDEGRTLYEKWHQLLESTMERKEEWLQDFAVEGIRAMACTYGTDEVTLREYMKRMRPSEPVFGRRGYALLLGKLCSVFNQQQLEDVIRGLVDAARAQDEKWKDAEARRNCVIALTSIVRSLGFTFKNVIHMDLFKTIINGYLKGLEDYTTDQRGDVGSWIREESMKGIEVVVMLINQLESSAQDGERRSAGTPASDVYLTPDLKRTIMGALLRQAVERIDRIRACAGKVLTCLLYGGGNGVKLSVIDGKGGDIDEPAGPVFDLPGRDTLEGAIPRDGSLNWISPSEVYCRLVQLIKIPEYRFDVLVGMIISAGGLTESLVRHASSCLLEFIGSLPDATNLPDTDLTLAVFSNTLLEIFRQYQSDNRIIVPLLEVVGLLLDNGSLRLGQPDHFFIELFDCVKKQVFKCRDVRKLTVAIRIFCNLATSDGAVHDRALQQCLTYLRHPFPKIRRTVAENLYLGMSASNADPTEESMELEDILVSTDWDSPVAQLKATRSRVYELVGLDEPNITAKK